MILTCSASVFTQWVGDAIRQIMFPSFTSDLHGAP
jgi:hypothetical protein